MKKIRKTKVICIILTMILFWGCKKEEVIHYDEIQNLRINQVQFYGSGRTGDNTIIKRVMKYYYG